MRLSGKDAVDEEAHGGRYPQILAGHSSLTTSRGLLAFSPEVVSYLVRIEPSNAIVWQDFPGLNRISAGYVQGLCITSAAQCTMSAMEHENTKIILTLPSGDDSQVKPGK